MRELTGRDVLAITVGSFGIIIAVNGLLAYKAVSTFPGLEVASSYQAGVGFDARRAAQVALGWDVQAAYQAGQLTMGFKDASGPVQPRELAVMVGRVTEAADDFTATLVWDGHSYAAPVDLAPGLWRVDIDATAANGTVFKRRLELRVRTP